MLKSIQSRLVFAVVVLILFLQASTSGVHYFQVRDIVTRHMLSDAQSTTVPIFSKLSKSLDNLAPDEPHDALLSSYTELMGFADFPEMLKTYVDMQSVAFIDTNGIVIGTTETVDLGKKASIDILAMLGSAEATSRIANNKILVYVPYFHRNTNVGGLVLTYSDEVIVVERHNILRNAVHFALAYALAGCFLAWIIARAIISPVQLLTKTFRAIAQNPDHYKPDPQRSSEHFRATELVQLDTAFNTMLRRLQESQDELRNLNQSLETRVKDRTEALEAAKRTAEHATNVKSLFLANMSHEIRTPLNAIIGLSGLAMRLDTSTQLRDYLAKIQNSGNHLLGIVSNILDFTKIEVGNLEVEKLPFTLTEVIDNLVNIVDEVAESKGLELVCSVDPKIPPTLLGDPLRLGQILINFTNNAVKFTTAGEVRVAIELLERTDSEVRLKFSVTDTGIGLTEAQMPRLFKTFEQADSSTTRQYGGTGLGLALCKSVAHALGGEVGADSTFGKGSTFWFIANFGIGSQVLQTQTPAVNWHGTRVLVVDDSLYAAQILCETLAAMAFTIDSVHSGSEALRRIQDAHDRAMPYDFAVIDWRMPEMDGLETVRALHQLNLQTPPIVLMATAHRKYELAHDAKSLGVEAVIEKPINSTVLTERMAQLLHSKRNGGAVIAKESLNKSDGIADSGPSTWPVPMPPATAQQLGRLCGMRTLVIEDNEINQQVICEMLQSVGILVDVADNGEIGAALVTASATNKRPYHLVMTDMQMPVMDGVECARRIRQQFNATELPIIAVTANATHMDRARCLEVGMNDFLTKPVEPELLLQTALRWTQHVTPERADIETATTLAAQPIDDDDEPQSPAVAAILALENSLDKAILNVTLGIGRTNNKTSLYTKIMRKFMRTEHDFVTRTQAALAASDTHTAERMAHTLKGVAATLGATQLQRSAHQLEDCLRNSANGSEHQEALQHTAQELELILHVLQPIDTLLSADSLSANPSLALTQEQHAQAQELVNELRALLRDDDARAVKLWETHAALLRHYCSNPNDVESAINAFEYESALNMIADHPA